MAGDRTGFDAVVDRLYALKPVGRTLGIDRMRPLAAELGHPESGLPIIHIAGTNGKGSVAAMIEAILRAAGWRVGLYTSPHLVHVAERVQVNRQLISEAEIVAAVSRIDALSEQIGRSMGESYRPSFFEYLTAIAFLEFRRQKCDVAVVEVGLGGEFDATNIVEPEVSVITSIGLDHREWLGDRLEDIARAKAGIIKPQRPVVIGRLPVAAEAGVRTLAAQRGAPVTSVRDRFGESLANYPETRLAGAYQRWNAATATLAVRTLDARWNVTPQLIARGLSEVSWAGRWERTLVGGRSFVLDASHNPEGASVLDDNLRDLTLATGRAPVVIVGVLGADRAEPLLQTIARHAREIHLVVPSQPRACSHEQLAALIPSSFSGRVIRSLIDDVFPGGDICTAGQSDDVVVVTGSIYLLGEVMQRLGR